MININFHYHIFYSVKIQLFTFLAYSAGVSTIDISCDTKYNMYIGITYLRYTKRLPVITFKSYFAYKINFPSDYSQRQHPVLLCFDMKRERFTVSRDKEAQSCDIRHLSGDREGVRCHASALEGLL